MRMIEKVARSMRDTGLLEGMSDEDADTLATAALEGMKEPSDAMRTAFNNDYTDWFNEVIEDSDHLYKVMIDAALNE